MTKYYAVCTGQASTYTVHLNVPQTNYASALWAVTKTYTKGYTYYIGTEPINVIPTDGILVLSFYGDKCKVYTSKAKVYDWRTGEKKPFVNKIKESDPTMTRNATTEEIQLMTKNPTIVFKFVRVQDGKYRSMNVRTEGANAGKSLVYELGKVTEAPADAPINTYITKDRAIEGLPFYDPKYREGYQAVLLRCAVVGEGVGFFKNRPHMPQFTAVIPLEKVWADPDWKPAPKYRDVTKNVTNECKVVNGGGSESGFSSLYPTLMHKTKTIAYLGTQGIELTPSAIKEGYSVVDAHNGWGYGVKTKNFSVMFQTKELVS